MKKISYIFVLIGALLLLAGCEMPFPSGEEVTGGEETLVVPTAVSDPNATSLPDGSGSTDPNVGGGAPDVPAATDVPVTVSAAVEETAVSPTIEPAAPTTEPPTATVVVPTATSVPPTAVPPTAIPATVAPVATTAPAQPQRAHVVQPGENLYRISLQYGLIWTEVAAANGITDPNTIVVGQTLIIPGDAVSDPPAQSGTHVVQPNENLYQIGLLYGLPWTVIAAANEISDPNAVYAGQVLIIPAN